MQKFCWLYNDNFEQIKNFQFYFPNNNAERIFSEIIFEKQKIKEKKHYKISGLTPRIPKKMKIVNNHRIFPSQKNSIKKFSLSEKNLLQKNFKRIKLRFIFRNIVFLILKGLKDFKNFRIKKKNFHFVKKRFKSCDFTNIKIDLKFKKLIVYINFYH